MMEKRFLDERGQTAILSVIFFTILMMILTVSFMKIVAAEQTQTTNNELEASAMASAESGIEDAKRVITYCTSTAGASDPGCAAAIGSGNPSNTSCTAVNSVLSAAGAVGTANTTNSQIQVGTTGNQYYSCLIINMLTADYTGTLTADGQSQIIPLDLVKADGSPATAAYIAIQWHSNQVDGDGAATTPLANSDLPSVGIWTAAGTNRPAVLRAEVAQVPSSYTIDTLTGAARAVTLRPSSSPDNAFGASSLTAPAGVGTGIGLSGSLPAYSIDSWTPGINPNSMTNTVTGATTATPLLQKNCSTAAGGYQCYVILTNKDVSTDTKTFVPMDTTTGSGSYLRLQAIYRPAHYRITAYDASGNQLYFNGVEPSVDVTGRTSDSYKRLKARLVPANNNGNTSADSWFPEYAVDTGGQVCKDLKVTSSTSGIDNDCY